MASTSGSAELILYSFSIAPFSQPVEALLFAKDVELERVEVNGKKDKPDWFKELSPTQEVPVLRVGERVIFDSRVICEYLDEAFLPRSHPEDAVLRNYHRAWMTYAALLLQDLFPILTARELEATTQRYHAHLARLEQELPGGPWFAGDTLSLVDFALTPIFVRHAFLERRFGFSPLGRLAKIDRWSTSMLRHEATAASTPPDLEATLKRWIVGTNAALAGDRP